MDKQKTAGPRANALKRELVFAAEVSSRAPAAAVYDLLTDVRSHIEWGGKRQKRSTRLITVAAPEGPASVGTEFATTGSDEVGMFTDRSVVTEARGASLFEFVTEAHLEMKKGKVADWTIVHRYQLSDTPVGCRIAYAARVTRISALPGKLSMFDVPGLGALLSKVASGVARRGTTNLARLAEERA